MNLEAVGHYISQARKAKKMTQAQLAAMVSYTPQAISLIEQGKSRSQIADCFFISENTVKYHVKNIFSKLGATSVTQAVWLARVLGII